MSEIILESHTETDSPSPFNTKLIVGLILVVVLCIGALLVELGRNHFTDKALPGQYVQKQNFSALNQRSALQRINNLANQMYSRNLTLIIQDNDQIETTYSELPVDINLKETFNQLQFYKGKPDRIEFIKDIFKSYRYSFKNTVNTEKLKDYLVEHFPDLSPAQSAYFTMVDSQLELNESKKGILVDMSDLESKLLVFKSKISLQTAVDTPSVSMEDLDPFKEDLTTALHSAFKLEYGQKSYHIPIIDTPEIVAFSKNDDTFSASLSKEYLNNFINEHLSPDLEKEAGYLVITDNDGKLEFEGTAGKGQTINRELLAEKINTKLTNKMFNGLEEHYIIEIPVESVDPKLDIPLSLQEKGIKDLLSYGYTTFYGSSSSRIHNIALGASQYDGFLLAPGEEFSFNDNLGPVDAASGYVPELVIKGIETIPEYGGGLCQVSTTFYRGALFAGLDITERRNHSYVVSYYSQVLGDGLDATIYPGVVDLKFVNNTPAHLLIYSIVEGAEMTTLFLGTKDDREVTIDNYKILYRTGSGEPIYRPKPGLAPGAMIQTQVPIGGLGTEWTRTVSLNGKKNTEIIKSSYRPVAAEYATGPSINEPEPIIIPMP